jgi:S1-C subfamily serine protease
LVANRSGALFSPSANYFFNSFRLVDGECKATVGSETSDTSATTLPSREIARRVLPSVVLVVMEDSAGKPISFGSGFFVKPNLVATSNHVVKGGHLGYIKLVGQTTTHRIVSVVARSAEKDLALLSVGDANASALALEASNQPQVGDEVYVAGNPEGLEGTFSQGIVSSIRRAGPGSLIQITAPISPGSSGGPVLNSNGKVIGIAVASFKGGQNLNFAIPAPYLAQLISVRRGVTTVLDSTKSNE